MTAPAVHGILGWNEKTLERLNAGMDVALAAAAIAPHEWTEVLRALQAGGAAKPVFDKIVEVAVQTVNLGNLSA